jgi:hypothetical protein
MLLVEGLSQDMKKKSTPGMSPVGFPLKTPGSKLPVFSMGPVGHASSEVLD